MTETKLPAKKDVALALLESSTVYVHLDPRTESVAVPPWFKKRPQLVLQIGLNMPVPIPDLAVEEYGISCTLSFSRTPHFCNVPWEAIYALVGEDGRGMVWPEDVPPEVAAQTRPAGPKPDAADKRLKAVGAGEPRPTKKSKSSRKRAQPAPDSGVPAQSSAAEASKPSDAAPSGADTGVSKSTPGKRKLPPYLRVVK